MKLTVSFLLILLNAFSGINAQVKIKGKYSSNTCTFVTKDKTYWIGFFDKGVARLFKKGYVGLIDTTGRILCTPKYDQIYPFQEKVALTGLNGKYGIIDKNGKELCPPIFQYIKQFFEDKSIFVDINQKKGVIDNKGKILTSKRYDYISNYKNGFATFKREKTFGIINENGKERIILAYQNKQELDKVLLSFNNSYGKKWRIGNLEEHNFLFQFNEGLAVHFAKSKDSTYKYGFINPKGKFVISPKYDFAKPFINQYAIVRKEKYWGVINQKGNTVIPFIYNTLVAIPGNRFVISKQGKYGVIDANHRKLLPIYRPPLVHLFGNLFAFYKYQKWGIINLKGKQVLPNQYDGFAMGKDGKKIAYTYSLRFPPIHQSSLFQALFNSCQYRYFTKTGELKDDKIYTGMLFLSHNDIYRKKFPKTARDFYYIPFYSHPDQYIQAKTQDGSKKYTIIHSLKGGYKVIGEEVNTNSTKLFSGLEFNQDPLEYSFQESKSFMKKYKKGVIDYQGSFVIPISYNSIAFKENLLIVKKNHKYGLINLSGEQIIPFEYDHMTFASAVIIAEKIADKSYSKIPKQQAVFDYQGNMLIPFKSVVYREGKAGGLFSLSQKEYTIIDKSKID